MHSLFDHGQPFRLALLSPGPAEIIFLVESLVNLQHMIIFAEGFHAGPGFYIGPTPGSGDQTDGNTRFLQELFAEKIRHCRKIHHYLSFCRFPAVTLQVFLWDQGHFICNSEHAKSTIICTVALFFACLQPSKGPYHIRLA